MTLPIHEDHISADRPPASCALMSAPAPRSALNFCTTRSPGAPYLMKVLAEAAMRGVQPSFVRALTLAPYWMRALRVSIDPPCGLAAAVIRGVQLLEATW